LLVDLHPLFNMVASTDRFALDFPYANDGPRAFDEPGSYAGADLDVAATATVVYGHSLADVVNAALEAGLKIQRLDEHLESDFDPRGGLLTREDDGRYRLRVDGERLPVLFALVAAKP
jgi:hypothetical protein